MAHEISMDDGERGYIAVNKFVTAADTDGNIATRIHCPPTGKLPRTHDKLMIELLVQIGVTNAIPNDVQLSDHKASV